MTVLFMLVLLAVLREYGRIPFSVKDDFRREIIFS